jgi:uncharacterized membrane protein (DUF373 family)
VLGWRGSGKIGDPLQRTREAWPALTVYERFEQVVSLALGLLISVLIVVALFHLCIKIGDAILRGVVDPAQQEVFQALFGMVMTVLIALEFNHSILRVLERRHGIIQVKTVILIALLALVRKFIIIDAAHFEPMAMISLAAAILALGIVYWLMRDQDRCELQDEDAP